MGVKVLHLSKLLFISLLLIVFNNRPGYSIEKEIEGVINKYARVTIIFVSPSAKVIVNDASNFAAGDTVLLIQMQGVEILTDDATYGTIQDTLGTPGSYEFLIIQSVNVNEIVFRNNILGSYSIKGNLQLVRVPYYNNAIVKNTLTSAQWDDPSNPKTGGVVAFIVGRSLKLNADIDVSGKGFKGGDITTGAGICISTNPALYDLASYNNVSPNSGSKGEGVAIHNSVGGLLIPDHSLGMGANYSGGGGGNGWFSGGGGGTNRGFGGKGGIEKSSDGVCAIPRFGGLGGVSINASARIANGIFLGGGGGSSTYTTGTASPGGNGGGIIIIITDTIIGNGRSIKADGAGATNASFNAGAGGGGGGGSVVLSLQSYSDKALTISSKGGNGGTHPGFGDGGSGGGGFIWVSTSIPSIPNNVTLTTLGGAPGISGEAGTVGETRDAFKALLNGFLFNSIRSSITGNLVDSICSNVVPKQITGTSPVGGTGPYTYVWQISSDDFATAPLVLPNDPDPKNYTPSIVESGTIYFRRIITDSSTPTALVDVSKSVKVIVQPKITGNKIGKDTIICYNQDPLSVGQLLPTALGAGNGNYTFMWRDSIGNTNAPGINTLTSYNSPPITRTTYYERIVTSGRCIDNSKVVRITVLDTISNNKILSLPQEICFGTSFTDLTAAIAPSLAGGDNSYIFKWESNINSSGWGIAQGVSNASGYNPSELPERVPSNQYSFRRIVYSGLHDVCINTSRPVVLKDFPVITNNTITANQTICSGSSPSKLFGSDPLNGNGTYIYMWQDSTKSHTWAYISGAIAIDYQPTMLTDTTSFRRIVFSSECSNTSKSIRINVHKQISTIELLDLMIPEGFSPNGDAINDEFEILGLDIGHNTASLTIINSYGSQVFKDDNYEGKWNGIDSNSNELPEGTYYYLLTIQSDRIDKTTKKSGFIILKR